MKLERIFSSDINNWLIFEIYKQLIILNIKKFNQEMYRRSKQIFFQKGIQMANRPMESCSISLIMRNKNQNSNEK